VKRWPIRSRLAAWTAFFLTSELIIFAVASGWVIYDHQLEAFREIEEKPNSPSVITEEANELVSDLVSAYLTALPLGALVAAFGVWWITRKALRPLQDVADTAEQIHAKALDQRLPQPSGQDEVSRMVRVLNDTFDRLERSFAQATRFSGDASHELKTPLTIMRGEIESALKSQLENPEIENLLVDLLNQTERLSSITEKLLLLSRADAGALVLKKEAVEFSAMCRDLVEDAEILGMRRKITTKAEISPGVIVWADQSYVRQALLNLLENAIKYNVESGTISISLTKSNSLALFRIANTGTEIPKEHETFIFERFYRADPSRSTDIKGSGLGLSICREIALAHGGQIWLERLEPYRTAFVLALPGLPNGRDSLDPTSAKLSAT
jgi:two-component system, OmpR family, heavy metal sensor histidine kinase CusS